MNIGLPPLKVFLIVLLASVAFLAGDRIAVHNTDSLELLGGGKALADDDDDGDDDSGGGGSGARGDAGSYGGSGGSGASGGPGGSNLFDILRNRFVPRRVRPAAVPPPPTRASDEIVGLGLTPPQLNQLSVSGFTVLESNALTAFNTEVARLRIPAGLTLGAARQQVADLAPQAVIDFNHYFEPEQAALARAVVGWPASENWSGRCADDVRMGLIDTAINSDHIAFEGGDIEVIRLVDAQVPKSGKQHGTAVAALLVGSASSRSPGLVPGGTLIAVDAFHRTASRYDLTDAYSLVRALDLLAGRRVDVINLSLAGVANLLLERAVAEVAERGIIMVAAAGNEGPNADPVYPAAYEQVLAVTAIDRRKRPYRRAGRGQHIDLSAPGVAVWTAASISGARPKTGTSFAAPFVTAAVAIMRSADPDLTPEAIREALAKSAEDLGEPGKDPIYGWGLLNARAICATRAPG